MEVQPQKAKAKADRPVPRSIDRRRVIMLVPLMGEPYSTRSPFFAPLTPNRAGRAGFRSVPVVSIDSSDGWPKLAIGRTASPVAPLNDTVALLSNGPGGVPHASGTPPWAPWTVLFKDNRPISELHGGRSVTGNAFSRELPELSGGCGVSIGRESHRKDFQMETIQDSLLRLFLFPTFVLILRRLRFLASAKEAVRHLE